MYFDVFDILLISIDVLELYGNRALHVAAETGKVEIVDIILQQPSVEVDSRNNVSDTVCLNNQKTKLHCLWMQDGRTPLQHVKEYVGCDDQLYPHLLVWCGQPIESIRKQMTKPVSGSSTFYWKTARIWRLATMCVVAVGSTDIL